MDYKKEFREAREANDWTRLQKLWSQLCQVAEIEEVTDGDGDVGKRIAEKQNTQRGPHKAYGREI